MNGEDLKLVIRKVEQEAFPPYESLSPEAKEAWGNPVTSGIIAVSSGHKIRNAMFRMVIPANAAKLYQGARLYFKDPQGRTLAEANAGLSKAEDGSLSISIELLEGFDSATLIVCGNDLSEIPVLRDMGGFSCEIPKPMAGQGAADPPAPKPKGKGNAKPEPKVRPR